MENKDKSAIADAKLFLLAYMDKKQNYKYTSNFIAEIMEAYANQENQREDNGSAEKYLEEINSIMWNSWGIIDRPFGRNEGKQIMDVLNKWASQPPSYNEPGI